MRPNQVFLTNGNRTDVFFKAPVDSGGKVYTILAQEYPLPTDNFQQRLQMSVASGRTGFSGGNPAPIDVVVGYVKMTGEPVAGGDFDVMSLRETLPPVPGALLPWKTTNCVFRRPRLAGGRFPPAVFGRA